METAGQWCDNASCPDCGKIGADNIKMHSYVQDACAAPPVTTLAVQTRARSLQHCAPHARSSSTL